MCKFIEKYHYLIIILETFFINLLSSKCEIKIIGNSNNSNINSDYCPGSIGHRLDKLLLSNNERCR